MSKTLILAITFSFVGLFDSLFLFYKYINADPFNCFLFDGCNTVANSPYSNVFGMPLPTFGVVFYAVMFLITFLLFHHNNVFLMRLALLGGFVGFVFSLYFVFLQGFIIQAFCVYCLISALSSVALLCALIFESNKKTETKEGLEEKQI